MPLPRGCKIREIDTGTRNCFQFQLDCPNTPLPSTQLRSLGTGMIKACRYRRKRGRVVYGVERLYVQQDVQRRGLATALYERAAQEACRRRAHLGSIARQRGSYSFEFWMKQFVKGRAFYWPFQPTNKMISPGFDREFWSRTQDMFVLKNCDQPIDLSGLSRMRPSWIKLRNG